MSDQWRAYMMGWLLLVAAVGLVVLAVVAMVLGGLWLVLYTAA